MNSIKLILQALLLLLFVPLQAQHINSEIKALIKKAKSKSHTLIIDDLKARQNEMDAKTAKSVLLPKVTLNANYTRLNDDIVLDDNMSKLLMGTQAILIKEGLGMPLNTQLPPAALGMIKPIPPLLEKDVFKANADIEWVLFSGLKVNKNLKAIKHKAKALEYQNITNQEKLALSIIKTYDQLALVRASKKVLETTNNYLSEQERFVSGAIKNGLAIPIDQQKIKLAKSQLDFKKVELNNNEAILISYLHQLTNVDEQTISNLQAILEPIAVQQSGAQIRHELLALQEVMYAKCYLANAEKTFFIPQLAIKSHIEFLKDDLSLLEPKWYIGAGLKWTVFDGLTGSRKGQKMELEFAEQMQQYEEAEELINLSNTKAELNYKTAQQQIKSATNDIELTKKTYDIVSKQYKNGLSTMANVLEAVKDIETTRFNYQQAIFNQRQAAIEWLHAKGLLINEL